MTRRAIVGVAAVFGSPAWPGLLIMIAMMWVATGDIYAAAVGTPRGAPVAAAVAVLFVAANLLISFWLCGGLLKLVRELRECRLPAHGVLIAQAVAFILCLTLLAPCALAVLLHARVSGILLVGLSPLAGMAAAALWNIRVSADHPSGTPPVANAAIMTRPRLQPPASAWRALRTTLGSPYSPTSWQRRSLQVGVFLILLAGAPALVLAFHHALSARAFSALFKVAQFLGLLLAALGCWLWPLSRVILLFNPGSGALSDLALLPGLGTGRQQLRRLYVGALSVPACGLLVLLIIAIAVVRLEHLPNGIYIKLAAEFLLVPPVSLALVLVGAAKTRTPATRSLTLSFVSLAPAWPFAYVIWLVPDGWDILPLRTLWLAFVLLVMAIVIGIMAFAFWTLARRPHPFVEVAS